MRFLAALTLLALCTVSMVSGMRLKRYDGEEEEATSDLKDTEYRADAGLPKELSPTDLALSNMTQAATSTKMNLESDRMDDAVQTAEDLKNAANQAVETDAITPEDAAEIKDKAKSIKLAAESGDQPTAIQEVKQLQSKIDEVVASQKGPEVEDKLKKADAMENEPVLSTNEDMKILRAAVADVIEADPLVPDEKKKEATDFTVRMIQEGFEKGSTTNEQLISTVEAEAAKQNMTEPEVSDRHYGSYHYKPYWWYYNHGHHHHHHGHHHHGRHHGRHHHHHHHGRHHHRGHRRHRDIDEDDESPKGSDDGDRTSRYYDPYYYNGHGFRQCLYWSSYRHCRRQLFGDYTHHHKFHNFFRRPSRRHWS